jgi:hypothetical protein
MAPERGKGARIASKKRGLGASRHPRHSLDKSLRVPKAILDQNAGKPCTDAEAVKFLGLKLTGAMKSEISSAIKYGLLSRPSSGTLEVTERAKKAIRPQSPSDAQQALREAVLDAPVMSDVYKHYRGENLPDATFFDNALTDTFKLPTDDLSEFKTIFLESLRAAQLIDEYSPGKLRVLDVSQQSGQLAEPTDTLKKLGKVVSLTAGDSCFVLMPFAPPLGRHYELIYEPAIKKAGLVPVRADADIFATGKIMEQVWSGINAAKVLVAELTSRNPNVFYELGIAHALKKPVVLISATEDDVPFDVRHIRVIYYEVTDPFWGEKLLNKVAENILSALSNPQEAVFEQVNE